MKQPHSLFLRLVVGCMSVMFCVWTLLVAAVIAEALHRGTDVESAALDLAARQALLLLREHASRDAELITLAREFEQLENQRRDRNDGTFARLLDLQVWRNGTMVYGKSMFPDTLPRRDGIQTLKVDGQQWLTVARADAPRGIAVRAIVQEPQAVLLQPGNIGFYFLPIIISLPFFLLPVVLVVRAALNPVRTMAEAIKQRDIADLKPLGPFSYKELAPLVDALNALLNRLRERLEREREFLADAAHELKTPLAIIQVNADALDEANSAARASEAREGVRLGVARAAHAVHQLLAYARSGRDAADIVFEDLDLAELARDRLAALADIALQRDVDIEFLAPERCRLFLHKESVALQIDNLVGNAIKFSPPGALVRIAIEADEAQTVLSVADQGPGIPPELRRKVFHRFYRLPGETRPGSGLGLSIVERAAIRNHASVVLEDGPGGRGLMAKLVFRSRQAPTRRA